jgi:transcriptional regulator with XRE-family HTH domain
MKVKAYERRYFKALGAMVVQLRKHQKIPAPVLAKRLGVKTHTLYRYEGGDLRISVILLVKLSKIFNIPVEQLMGMTKSNGPPKKRLSPSIARLAERIQALSHKQKKFLRGVVSSLEPNSTEAAHG